MPMPTQITDTHLYRRLAKDDELTNSIRVLREKAESLATTLVRDAGTFTDHTIRHMDALWVVSEKVLTANEIEAMTEAEAFLLAAGFYLHDIGMAYAGTPKGKEELMQSPEYLGGIAGASPDSDMLKLQQKALAYAIRVNHAQKSEELATRPLPGTNEYLIEPQSVREQFGAICGKIAASHHWSIDKVDAELGGRGVVPLAKNREADLGFVAGVLRLIDYAHINRDRAPKLELALRPALEEDSEVHWNAQSNIDGPSRSHGSNELAYSALTPISDVDAWWLFYEFARGLDGEIRQVHRFLSARKVSTDRLSLVGVRGANSPEEFEKFVKTAGFLPLEVSVRASSITRLVRLLAGESLYGKNFIAPVRELIQNSLDAAMLRRATASSAADLALSNLPIEVSLQSKDGDSFLAVRDWGIGMTKKVIVDHLLTIASDYWENQFHIDFPKVSKAFSPAGRFGIGFLSVFMLGDDIGVSSQRVGSDRYSLSIRGLGRRAELREIEAETASGTCVQIKLNPEAAEAIKDLPSNLASYIPMLEVEVSVNWNGVASNIPPNWALQLKREEFTEWAVEAQILIREVTSGSRKEDHREVLYRRMLYVGYRRTTTDEKDTWPLGAPEYIEPNVRLVADRRGQSLLCLRGFALQPISTPGFVGIINSNSVTPDAARERGLDFDSSELLARAISSVKQQISDTLTERTKAGFIPDQLEFVEWCAIAFGKDAVEQSNFPWIQVVEASGDARFVTTTELNKLVSGADALFLGLNTGPISVSKSWRSHSQMPMRRELGICFSAEHVSYITGDEKKTGSLTDLWADREYSRRLALFLEIVCRVWDMPLATLLTQDSLMHESSVITGMLVR